MTFLHGLFVDFSYVLLDLGQNLTLHRVVSMGGLGEVKNRAILKKVHIKQPKSHQDKRCDVKI